MFTKTQNTKRFCKFQVTLTLSLRHEEMRNKIALESRIYCKLFSNLDLLSVPYLSRSVFRGESWEKERWLLEFHACISFFLIHVRLNIYLHPFIPLVGGRKCDLQSARLKNTTWPFSRAKKKKMDTSWHFLESFVRIRGDHLTQLIFSCRQATFFWDFSGSYFCVICLVFSCNPPSSNFK